MNRFGYNFGQKLIREEEGTTKNKGGGQGRIQELKGGGAEVKYLLRENFTLRHSHFGVIRLQRARGPNGERGPGEAFKSIRVALKGSWKGICASSAWSAEEKISY